MEIINLTKKKYKDWDNFCLESDDAWFWHTSLWLEYTLNYNPGLKPESKSFFVLKDNKIVAICPLILETHDGIKEFSFGGGHGPVPAFAGHLSLKERHDIGKDVFEHIDKLAEDNNISRTRFRFSVLNKSFIGTSLQKFNFLIKFGYIDNSLATQILDVKKPIEELKKDLRHGHRSDVDKAEKIFKVEIFDKSNITDKAFNDYRKLHQKAAGRITRPKITFDIMHELIKSGGAFLAKAERDGKTVAFSYFFVFKNNVYYGSACTDPDLGNLPASHLIQWKAIKYMQEKGFSFYEIGWQYFGATICDFPSQKEINIARFKKGFGGYAVSLFRGEKFYDKNYFLKLYQERINKFSDYI